MNLLIPLIASCLTSMFLQVLPVNNPREIDQKIEFNDAVTDYVQTAICADFVDVKVPETSMKYITQGLSIPDDSYSRFTISQAEEQPTFSLGEFIPLSILLVTSTVITI